MILRFSPMQRRIEVLKNSKGVDKVTPNQYPKHRTETRTKWKLSGKGRTFLYTEQGACFLSISYLFQIFVSLLS